MTNIKYFEVERITNGASGEKRTTKTFKDEEKAMAYAKRYHRTTKTIKSVKTTVYCFNGTDTGITYRANTKDGTEKDYRASEQKQTTEEKEYIFFSPKTGRYAARRFRGTEEAVIADTERRIEERDYARDFCLVIREVISKGKSKFIKAINWNDDYRIACGWYSEIVYSKEEAMKKAEELANKEKKAVNVYVTYLNSNGHAVEEQIDTVEPNKDELTWSYEPIDKPIEKEIKTLQDWEKKGGNFTDFCKVGDKVDKGIVDYFVDVLPPITWRTDLVQCGEPYGHRNNPKTGRWEAMYITFAKNDNGQWYYAGICFLNQREKIA